MPSPFRYTGQSREEIARTTTDIHVLRYGYAICEFSAAIPKEWPAGHRWESADEFVELLKGPYAPKCCANCRSVLDAEAEARRNPPSDVVA